MLTEIFHIAELCPFGITPVGIKAAALYYFAMVHEFAVMGHSRRSEFLHFIWKTCSGKVKNLKRLYKIHEKV